MATYQLDCKDCGAPCQVHRSDGKFCPSCRLLRVLKFASTLPKQAPKCRSCDAKFRPLNKKDYALCGTCTPPSERWPSGTCSLCRQAASFPYRGVAVCLACLKDPVQRPQVFEALRRGQAARKKANAGRPRQPLTRVENDDTTPAPT